MANLFDTTNYPTREPDSLEAGDRWAWKRTDLISDYPSSAYTLSYVLRREITGERIAVTASAGSDGYLVEVSSTTTAVSIIYIGSIIGSASSTKSTLKSSSNTKTLSSNL